MADNISSDLKSGALFYHRYPRPGKLEIQPTKPLGNQRDLALAYSPGVAAAMRGHRGRSGRGREPDLAPESRRRRSRTARPCSGSAISARSPRSPSWKARRSCSRSSPGSTSSTSRSREKNADKLVEVIAALEPTFGGINLEDIKAPECFEVEERLKARMGIPVFHDDQHGTAIIVGGRGAQRARSSPASGSRT